MKLGIAEFSVPGKNVGEKLRALERYKLWLELANDGKIRKFERWKELLSTSSVRVNSVQAYIQHRLSFLSSEEAERKAAITHVKQSIVIAAEFSANNVVTVLCYGEPGVEKPRRETVRVLKDLGKTAEDRGVTIAVEPLDVKRTSFMPSAEEVWKLVEEVGSERVKLMLDTGHMWDNKEDIGGLLQRFGQEIVELHLKDSNSLAPGKGEIDFRSLIDVCRRLSGLKCLEYRPSEKPENDLEIALRALKNV